MGKGPWKRALAPIPSLLPGPPGLPARRPSDGNAVPLKATFAAVAVDGPTARLALRNPLRVFGAKATAMSQLAPGCSVVPQPLEVSRKSAGLVPTRADSAELVPTGASPSLRTVKVREALTASTRVPGKVAAPGMTDNPPPTAVPASTG